MADSSLTARGAAAVLEPTLSGFKGGLTVADGAARAGLSLRDAETGLRLLTSERGGQLAATETGELLYSFPHGLVAPPMPGVLARAARATGRALATVGRFVVRAWVSVVMVGYAILFAAVAIALATRDDDSGAGDVLGGIVRVVFEALYWTFHPFSPVNLAREPSWARQRWRRPQGLPFYERVNRFVFGPPPALPEDPRQRESRVLGEVRRLRGRVGPGDIMRVTGLAREAAERELLRLVVDYDGEIEVSDDGALVYVFKSLRVTTAAATALAPAPVWSNRELVPPLTGNGAGTNVMLTVLNGFNLAMGTVGVSMGLTVERIFALVEHARAVATLGADAPPLGPAVGVPVVLGWLPLAFSAGLFLLPAARALRRRRQRARVQDENGRRALMKLVLAESDRQAELTPEAARQAWLGGVGLAPRADLKSDPTPRIEAAVRALGGEIELDAEGKLVYRFATEARERRALEAVRAAVPVTEASPGAVVFSSD